MEEKQHVLETTTQRCNMFLQCRSLCVRNTKSLQFKARYNCIMLILKKLFFFISKGWLIRCQSTSQRPCFYFSYVIVISNWLNSKAVSTNATIVERINYWSQRKEGKRRRLRTGNDADYRRHRPPHWTACIRTGIRWYSASDAVQSGEYRRVFNDNDLFNYIWGSAGVPLWGYSPFSFATSLFFPHFNLSSYVSRSYVRSCVRIIPGNDRGGKEMSSDPH